ncbi:MAG: TlpA disulfide reductase family protein [Acidimicrobiales bacterium]
MTNTDETIETELAERSGDSERLAEINDGRPLVPIIAAIAALILVPLLWVLATSDTDGGVSSAASPLIGFERPAVAGLDQDGEQFDLSSFDGDWVVVNFFATWCAPCVAEHPELVEFEQRHAAAGDAHIVSVVFEDTGSNVSEFFAEHGGGWPVIVDRETTGSIALNYAVAQIPESFVVAPNGVVVTRYIGGFLADQVDGLIEQYDTGNE